MIKQPSEQHYSKQAQTALESLIRGLAINLYNTKGTALEADAKQLYNLAVNVLIETNNSLKGGA